MEIPVKVSQQHVSAARPGGAARQSNQKLNGSRIPLELQRLAAISMNQPMIGARLGLQPEIQTGDNLRADSAVAVEGALRARVREHQLNQSFQMNDGGEKQLDRLVIDVGIALPSGC